MYIHTVPPLPPAFALTSTEKLVKCVLTHDTFVLGILSCMMPLLDHPPVLCFLYAHICVYVTKKHIDIRIMSYNSKCM